MDLNADILFERRGFAGVITLNRPKALNAITHDMVRTLRARLDEWGADASIARVVIRAAGDRAFCAGGDIRALYDLCRAGRSGEALPFFRDEYRLNAAIKRFPKPYIALIDGLVMGGGFGVSVHGSHRIAGDRFQFAMPEVGIGFFPDVGATFVLPRFPGELGTWCALTGHRMNAADALVAGMATHRVHSERMADLIEALCGNGALDAILAAFSPPQPDPVGPVASRRAVIDRTFADDAVETILAHLDDEAARGEDDGDFAGAAAAAIRAKSPLSLKIALAQVRRGRYWSFEECMKAEFRIVSRVLRGQDFYEGVRAAVIDKDNAPRWSARDLAAVSADEVDAYFAPLDDELELI